MLFAFAFDIDKDVIEVHYHENVRLLCQDLVDIALEYRRCINQSKKHYLVLEMSIASPENSLLFVSFPNLHLMIGIG